MYICICKYLHVNICTCKQLYVFAFCVYTYVRRFTRIGTYIFTYTYIFTCIKSHTHIYIYTKIQLCIHSTNHIYIYTLKFILPKYIGRLCRYYFVWSFLRKPGVSQKTHTNLMKTRRYAMKIGAASGLPLVQP